MQRHLSGFEGVGQFTHVDVRRAGRRAALVEVFVELQALHRFVGVDEAFHVVGLVGVLVLEAVVVEDVRHAHRDAFRAALGVDRRAVDFFAVDLAALEELGDLLQLVIGRGRAEIPAVLVLEFLLQLGTIEPVLAVGPADDVAHRRKRPIVRRVLRPLGIADDGRRHEVVHRDAVLVEEVVQLDVVAVLRRAADPLAVADDEIAERAVRIELVQEAIGIARPWHELELHGGAGLSGEVLGELHQGVRRVPCGPAERQLAGLCGARCGAGNKRRRCHGKRTTMQCLHNHHPPSVFMRRPARMPPAANAAIPTSTREPMFSCFV